MNILTTMKSMNTHTGRWIIGELRTASAVAPHEVIKVGGSLLSVSHWPDLVAELVRLRSRHRKVIVVAGGGTIVEGLRTIDAAAPQRADAIHFLAIDLLGSTARLVARCLGCRSSSSPATIRWPSSTPRSGWPRRITKGRSDRLGCPSGGM